MTRVTLLRLQQSWYKGWVRLLLLLLLLVNLSCTVAVVFSLLYWCHDSSATYYFYITGLCADYQWENQDVVFCCFMLYYFLCDNTGWFYYCCCLCRCQCQCIFIMVIPSCCFQSDTEHCDFCRCWWVTYSVEVLVYSQPATVPVFWLPQSSIHRLVDSILCQRNSNCTTSYKLKLLVYKNLNG